MSQLPIIPPGLHVSATAIADFEMQSGIGSKSGKPWRKLVGRGIAGSQFVKVQQFLEHDASPVIVLAGEKFTAKITAVDLQEKGREVVSLFVEINRPAVLPTEGKK